MRYTIHPLLIATTLAFAPPSVGAGAGISNAEIDMISMDREKYLEGSEPDTPENPVGGYIGMGMAFLSSSPSDSDLLALHDTINGYEVDSVSFEHQQIGVRLIGGWLWEFTGIEGAYQDMGEQSFKAVDASGEEQRESTWTARHIELSGFARVPMGGAVEARMGMGLNHTFGRESTRTRGSEHTGNSSSFSNNEFFYRITMGAVGDRTQFMIHLTRYSGVSGPNAWSMESVGADFTYRY